MKQTIFSSSIRIPSLIAAAFFAIGTSANATTYYWNGSGAIATAASWGTNTNGTGTSPTNFTTAGNTFELQNGQTANLATSWTISGTGSKLLIDTGAIFNSNNSTAPTFTLDMQSGAAFNVVGSTTFPNITFGTINSASTFTISSAATTLANNAYGNLVWKSSGGNTTPSNDITTTGSLTIDSGAQLRTATSTTSRTWTIGDSLIINSTSTWGLSNASTGTATTNIANALTNNGTISKPGANGLVVVNFSGTGSSAVKWGTVTTTNFSTVTFNIGSTKTITFTDSLDEGAAAFAVNGTLNIGAQVLSGTTGTFTLASGANFITSNATGLDGAITVTGTKTLNSAANYEFQGAGTGALLPATVNNLTINRSSGNVTIDGTGATQTVSGALSILSGNLAAGATRNAVTAGSLSMRNTQINSGLTVTLGGNVTFDATNNGTATIAGNLDLGAGTRTFTVADGTATSDMTITGTIANGGLTKAGTGTLSLTNTSNTYAGGTIINAGTLAINAPNILGSTSGSLTINNAIFQLTTIGGTGTGISSARNIVLGNANSTIQVDTGLSYTANSSAVVSGAGALNKTGVGGLGLAGVNTYTGGTVVSAGTLLVSNTTDSATGTGSVAINNSGTILTGTGFINASASGATVTVNGILSPGAASAGTAGTINLAAVGGLTLSSSSVLRFDITTTSNKDLVALTTTALTLSGGTLALNLPDLTSSGIDYSQTYSLFTGVSSLSGSGFSSVTGYDSTDFVASFALNGSSYDLTFTAAVPEPSTYIGGGLILGLVAFSQRKRLGQRSQTTSFL